MRIGSGIVAASVAALVLGLLTAVQAEAQTPKNGGMLTLAAQGAPPTLDCAAVFSLTTAIDVVPMYSTLYRYDPDTYPTLAPDLADSYTISSDGTAYTFKLHPDVHFQDGSILKSDDVKASFLRMKSPPDGVVSVRQSLFANIASIDTPDPLTVVFHLATRTPLFLNNVANPFACIYSKAQLDKDPKSPEKTPMGTGPFMIDQYVPGASISFKRFPDYFNRQLVHLDALKVVFLIGPAYTNAIAGGQVDGAVTAINPPDIARIKATQGDKVVYPIAPYTSYTIIDINTTKKPFDDVRVRQALSMSLDRSLGDAMLRATFHPDGPGDLLPRGAKFDMSKAEFDAMPGFDPDKDAIAAARAKARALMAAAGQTDLHTSILGRNTGEPYNTIGIFMIDQLKQIGVTMTQNLTDAGPYNNALAGRTYELATDSNATVSDDPSEFLVKFLPSSGNHFTGENDQVLQDLYDKQAVETDDDKRRALVTQFQKRVIVDEAYVIPMYRTTNQGAMQTYVKGWKIMNNPGMNMDFRNVWLDK